MFSFIQAMAEERIRQAQDEGQFQDLPGRGEPLDLDCDPLMPADLRMAYTLLKNAGFVPPEIQQEKEIDSMLELISHLEDVEERYRQIRKLNYLVMQLNMKRKRPISLEKSQYYEQAAARVQVLPGRAERKARD
jgi:hypothetical protein